MIFIIYLHHENLYNSLQYEHLLNDEYQTSNQARTFAEILTRQRLNWYVSLPVRNIGICQQIITYIL